MNSVNVTIRMDKKLKQESEELFNDLGLSLSAAFNIFVRQAVREQRIPFEIGRSNEIKFLSNEELESSADKEIAKHLEAYKELAK